jgi:hypothetical protein
MVVTSKNPEDVFIAPGAAVEAPDSPFALGWS